MGLADDENKRVLLAVWRLDSVEECMELPLHGWQGRKAEVRQLYPSQNYDVKFHYCERKGALTVRLPQNNQARLFEINENK